jgi:hypothetical protein
MLLKLFYQVERKEHYQTHPMKPVLPWYPNPKRTKQQQRKL